MRTGRNAPCPCNSGKKYKKCCINKDTSLHREADKTVVKYEYLNTVDTLSLLKTFAGLTLLPQNHGKYVRLKKLTVLALLHQHDTGDLANTAGVTDFLTEHFAMESLEDEPMCAFTDLVTFDGGNSIIFPGVDDSAANIVSNLLAGIYYWPDCKLPNEFKGNVYHISRLILAISNNIAERLGYSRYIPGSADDELLFVPDDNMLARLQQAVTFSASEMEQILTGNNIHPQALEDLLIDTSQINESWLDPELTAFSNGPICFTGTEYIVLHPISLAKTLIDRIWQVAEFNHCTSELNRVFHDLTWNNTKKNLGTLYFDAIEDGQIFFDSIGREALLSIDIDKLAYVHYAGDERNEMSFSPEQYLQRWQQIYTRLQSSEKYKNHQILAINIFASNGRLFKAPLLKVPNAITLTIPVFELDILADLKTVNALNLWKYATLQQELTMPGMALFSFIDAFKYYRENGDSFALKDAFFPLILPGYSADWVLAALKKTDRHSVLRQEQGNLHLIPVCNMDEYAPIYMNEMELSFQELNFAIEIANVPIWVGPNKLPQQMNDGLKNAYWQFTNAIAYWLWQLAAEIKATIDEIGMPVIKIGFQFDDPSTFATIQPNYTRQKDLDEKFKLLRTDDGLLMTIPQGILPYLYGADNEGERALVKNILKGFTLLLTEKNKSVISDDSINAIVERTAPLGNKKKVFIVDPSYNILLLPNNLKPPRLVQAHDVSLANQQINISSLPDLRYKGLITDKADKLTITNSVVQKILLPFLRNKLANYDSESLLKRLIGLNESLIKTREEIYLNTPTRIACFVSVAQHQLDLARQINENSRTNVAVRCLIEHIAAERYQGTAPISITAIDELVGIMDRIILWGGISDQINYDLLDTDLRVLDNGIIDIINEDAHSVLMNYHHQKTGQDIVDATKEFQEAFPVEENQEDAPISEAVEKAFLLDVGITLTKICEFLDCAATIGLQQSEDYGVSNLVNFRELMNAVGPASVKFAEAEFQAALSFLSLQDRGDVTKLPGKGYELIDISPWRYNRILSLLRRPLVVTGAKGNEMVYWGPRQCMQSKATIGTQIISGRFRALPKEKTIKSTLGMFANERGEKLVATILAGLQVGKPAGVFILPEQFIRPSGPLRNSTDIGDVDVLVIDPAVKVLYSVESKAISPSRSIKEMVEEVEKLFNEQDGWIKKHTRRHEWLTANLQQVSTLYGIDVNDYVVKSIFVTEGNMLTPHLKKIGIPLPLITRYDIEKTGYLILQSCK